MIKEALQYLVENQFYFAAFSLPNEKNMTTFVESNAANKEDFFKLHAFDSEKEIKIAGDFIAKNEVEYQKILEIPPPTFGQKIEKLHLPKEASQIEFEQYVEQIIDACKNKEIEKAVAARTIIRELKSDFNVVELLLNLCENYPSAFVHFSISKAGIWMGATPEILITQENELFTTVSLAGTKKTSENRAWTPKEIEEQAIVTRYILSKIEKETDKIYVSDTVSIKAGKIEHLKTTISFQSQKSIDKFTQILHPTPAVCGIPKQKAMDVISQNEGFDRTFYTGFLGFKEGNHQQYFVNLRCMQIIQNKAILYVGAGITKDSNPTKEWEETEAKSETLGRFL